MGSQLNIELIHSWCCNRSESQRIQTCSAALLRCSLFGAPASLMERCLGTALPRCHRRRPQWLRARRRPWLPRTRTAQPLSTARPQVRDAAAAQAKPNGGLPACLSATASNEPRLCSSQQTSTELASIATARREYKCLMGRIDTLGRL